MFRELVSQSLSMDWAYGYMNRLTDQCANIQPIDQTLTTVSLMPTYDIDLLSYDTVVFEFRYRSLGQFMFHLHPSLFPDVFFS